MGKKIILLCFIALSSLYTKANRPEINVSGPNTVAVGESFSIDYEIGTFDISNFQAPDFSGFRIINNHRNQKNVVTLLNEMGKPHQNHLQPTLSSLKPQRKGHLQLNQQ